MYAVKLYCVLSVYVPAWTVCSGHSGHHMHSAVVKGVMVSAVQKTVCCVLLRQYYLELVLHVQGKEEELFLYPCTCFAIIKCFFFFLKTKTFVIPFSFSDCLC